MLKMENAMDLFMKAKRATNCTDRTMDTYYYNFRRLQRFFLNPLDQVTASDAVDFLDTLRRDKLQSATVRMYFNFLDIFFGFLHKRKLIPANPCDEMEKPRVEQRIVNPLTMDQVEAILLQPKVDNFHDLRNFCMIVLLIDTGIRVSELTGLKCVNIDWRASTIKVLGKGMKERIVPICRNTKFILLNYFTKRNKINEGVEWFFYSVSNRNKFGRIDRSTFRKQLVAYGKKIGIKVSPHKFRHTFATEFWRSSGDIFTLQQLLGHSKIGTTVRYTHFLSSDIIKKHNKHTPAKKLKNRG